MTKKSVLVSLFVLVSVISGVKAFCIMYAIAAIRFGAMRFSEKGVQKALGIAVFIIGIIVIVTLSIIGMFETLKLG